MYVSLPSHFHSLILSFYPSALPLTSCPAPPRAHTPRSLRWGENSDARASAHTACPRKQQNQIGNCNRFFTILSIYRRTVQYPVRRTVQVQYSTVQLTKYHVKCTSIHPAGGKAKGGFFKKKKSTRQQLRKKRAAAETEKKNPQPAKRRKRKLWIKFVAHRTAEA